MKKMNSAGTTGINSGDPQKFQGPKNIHQELAETIMVHRKVMRKFYDFFIAEKDIHDELAETITIYRKTISTAQPDVVNNSTWLLFTGPQAA
ncbi:MAG: hypothetical protein JNK27_17335 [Chitinophagaceae bacterium]|nr:hypothetical protein [Chitinophagaceae bacterium]